MTNKEAFMFKSTATEQEAINALSFVGIDPDGTWDASADNCKFYSSLIDNVLKGERPGATSISQGDFSIRFNGKSQSEYAFGLARESGCQALIDKYNPQPKVVDKSYLW